ncbi:anti-sigma factor [Ferruginibacter sp.]
MNSNEFITSGIIETYVMGLCTAQEKAEVESMCLQYPEVQSAVLAFETALEKQFMDNPSSTTAALDEKILSSLSELNTPVIPIASKKMNWWKPAVAASLVLLIGSTVFNYTLYDKIKKQDRLLAEKETAAATLPTDDYNILKNPAITPVAMNGVGPHTICRCTMFWDKKTNKAYIMIHHLAKQKPGNNYQLWATVNGQPVSVGIIDDTIRDRFIAVSNVPGDATGFTVTLEKAGGAATPTTDQTYLVGRI